MPFSRCEAYEDETTCVSSLGDKLVGRRQQSKDAYSPTKCVKSFVLTPNSTSLASRNLRPNAIARKKHVAWCVCVCLWLCVGGCVWVVVCGWLCVCGCVCGRVWLCVVNTVCVSCLCVSQAPHTCVSVFGARGIVRRHRHCAVAMRLTLP